MYFFGELLFKVHLKFNVIQRTNEVSEQLNECEGNKRAERRDNVLFKWAHFSLINSLFRSLLCCCFVLFQRAHCHRSHCVRACVRAFVFARIPSSYLFELKQRLLCFICSSSLLSFSHCVCACVWFYFLSNGQCPYLTCVFDALIC